jgi:transketolase
MRCCRRSDGALSIEPGVTLGWRRWVGDDGDCIGIDGRLGRRPPAKVLLEKFGFTPERGRIALRWSSA